MCTSTSDKVLDLISTLSTWLYGIWIFLVYGFCWEKGIHDVYKSHKTTKGVSMLNNQQFILFTSTNFITVGDLSLQMDHTTPSQ